MPYYLAIDAGGSKTTALIADEQNVLARAASGSIKRLRVPPELASANLGALLGELAAASGVSLSKLTRTCVGASGITVPLVREWLGAELGARVGGELLLLGDEVIALDAAFPQTEGILVIAGTGSNVIGRGADGRLARAGGWGPALADEGSGHWIGHQALRAAFAECHGDVNDAPLLAQILQSLELASVDELVEAANAPGFRFADMVPAVVAAAAQGDSVATHTLLEAGVQLASLVLKVAAQLRFAAPAGMLPVAFIGSVLQNIAAVRNSMFSQLQRTHPATLARETAVDALEGALWHARGGTSVTPG